MPNWNYNSVEIYAPLEAVKQWLVQTNEKTFAFNMHKLFPEKIPADDPTGDKTWNYDWFVRTTGSKTVPEVMVSEGDEELTLLDYDSAWTPNNGTLQRLHELTGWTIVNEYEEPGMSFEGTLTCDAHGITDDEREYRPTCDLCEEKKEGQEFDNRLDGLICNDCRAKAKLIS